jgi:hypothetical protein
MGRVEGADIFVLVVVFGTSNDYFRLAWSMGFDAFVAFIGARVQTGSCSSASVN